MATEIGLGVQVDVQVAEMLFVECSWSFWQDFLYTLATFNMPLMTNQSASFDKFSHEHFII